jgi:hypothetical protein
VSDGESVVDDGVADEASGVYRAPETLVRGSKVTNEEYEIVSRDNDCEGEPRTCPGSELTSRSVMAGVCKYTCSLKPSHTSDVPF